MTPIEKNVIVVDEQGNILEATYPKRAKGLVKKGRARFISERMICLACPLEKFIEETEMEKTKKEYTKEEQQQFIEKANINFITSLKSIVFFVEPCSLSWSKTEIEILAKVDDLKRHYKNLIPTDDSMKAFICEKQFEGIYYYNVRQFDENGALMFEHSGNTDMQYMKKVDPNEGFW